MIHEEVEYGFTTTIGARKGLGRSKPSRIVTVWRILSLQFVFLSTIDDM